ncbi:hypothetical protein SGLAM104S_08818 [Streptomyces glaucescens]
MGAVVEQALAGESGGGAADRGDGDTGVEELPGLAGEGGEVVAGVPQVRARQDQQRAVLGPYVVQGEVGLDAQPADGADGGRGGAGGADLVSGAGEVGGGVSGLPVGEGVVDGEVDGLAAHGSSSSGIPADSL